MRSNSRADYLSKMFIVAVLICLSHTETRAGHAEPFEFNAEKIDYWLDNELQPSTLSRQQQLSELKWFQEAAKPYKDMVIRVVSERIDTHIYEANVLAKAFYDLTGIHVIHEITGEDDTANFEKFIAMLDDCDDVQNVYHNADIAES